MCVHTVHNTYVILINTSIIDLSVSRLYVYLCMNHVYDVYSGVHVDTLKRMCVGMFTQMHLDMFVYIGLLYTTLVDVFTPLACFVYTQMYVVAKVFSVHLHLSM